MSESCTQKNQEIVRVAIHPGIGIARVGNSREPDGFYIGPEVTNPSGDETRGMKDRHGALKRQAARFRVYGYNKDDEIVREITAADPATQIEWTVEVANKKAGWYQFIEALDLAAAPPAGRRNGNLQGAARQQLDIKPGPRSICGVDVHGPDYHFDSGELMGQKVYLGELRTDGKGRLLFLGGHGKSESAYAHNPPAGFGNNDGWYDDTSDGSVNAIVRIAGRDYEADGAWVVTAPPNYGTTLIGVKTMNDVMEDMFINPTGRSYWRNLPRTVYFTRHILPILQQFSDAQWVNYGFAVQFGFDGPFDFTRKEFLEKLSRLIPLSKGQQADETKPEEDLVLKKDVYQEFRRQIYNAFRRPDEKHFPVVSQWPWMYGDTVQLGAAPQDSNQYLSMTQTQLILLQRWVDGDFVDDLELPPDGSTHVDITTLYHYTYPSLEDYPVEAQGAELDKAAMHFCLGGAFHPGCEMTWPMRHATMYRSPYRLRPRTENNPEPDYGDELTHEKVIDENGPLYFSAPGDLTRWMAVPWQTDTSSCRSGYEPNYDPFLPTFWPARVPNHVLTEENYKIVMNEDGRHSLEERLAAFNNRAVWLRGLPGEYRDQIEEMVHRFGLLGVLEKRPGPKDPEFPDVIYVETGVGYKEPENPLANLLYEYTPSPSEKKYWQRRKAGDS